MDADRALRRLMDAKGESYTEAELARLSQSVYPKTVLILHDLLSNRTDITGALRRAAEHRLSPATRKVLEMINAEGFVSSYEVRLACGIHPSTAANRISSLVYAGLAKRAFSYIPQGGGRRVYFCRAETAEDPIAIQAFIAKLDAERL